MTDDRKTGGWAEDLVRNAEARKKAHVAGVTKSVTQSNPVTQSNVAELTPRYGIKAT